MNKLNLEQLRVVQSKPRIAGNRIGRIVALNDSGAPVVDWSGNPLGPQRARIVSAMAARLASAHEHRSDVLLLFEEDDPARPLILDVVQDAPSTVSEMIEPQTVHASPVARALNVPPARMGEVAAKLATIVAVEEDGVLVRWAEGDAQPIKARTAIALRDLKSPVIVLLLDRPVIVAQLYDRVPIEPAGGESAEVLLKGSRVRIEADVELVLKTGACTLRFDAQGKAVTTANQIVSRARDTNKVQGGSVQLN